MRCMASDILAEDQVDLQASQFLTLERTEMTYLGLFLIIAAVIYSATAFKKVKSYESPQGLVLLWAMVLGIVLTLLGLALSVFF